MTKSTARDFMIWIGLALICYGGYQLRPWIAFVIAGCWLVCVAIIGAMGDAMKEKK